MGDVVVVEDAFGVVVGAEGLNREGFTAAGTAEARDDAEGLGEVRAPGDEVRVGVGGVVMAVVDARASSTEGRDEGFHATTTRRLPPPASSLQSSRN